MKDTQKTGSAVKLNLGCGDRKYNGYLNVDLFGDPDVRCDLSRFPWPFEDNSVDEVYSEHFLEHVQDYEATIYEMHRILKPGGLLHFRVPHFSSMYFPWHLHHYAFSSVTCRLLCAKLAYQFSGRKLFDEVSLKFHHMYLPRPWNTPFSLVANWFPKFWEYFGLPIDEIEFVARKTEKGE